MSNVHDSKAAILNSSIGLMAAWDFWATPYGIGLVGDDAEAIRNGTADEAQQARARICLMAAKNALITAEVGIPFSRPS